MKCDRSEKGQAAVEFGVILPAMIILILAVVVYGKPYYQKLVAQNLAYSVCSSAPRARASQYNMGFPLGASIAAASTSGAGDYSISSGDLADNFSSVSVEGLLTPLPCEVRLDATFLDLIGMTNSSDTFVKGVAVFFTSPFLSNN